MTVFSVTSTIFVLYLNSFVESQVKLCDNDLVGLFPPVFTPMNDDFTLNLKVIPKYAKLMAENLMAGVVLSGTNGEGPATSYDERIRLIDAWYDAAKSFGLQLIVQVAGQPIPDTLRTAKYVGDKGVNAILALPELYYRPQTPRELVDYMAVIAEQAPNTPLLYYDIANTNVKINLTALFELASAEIPSFVGIKCLLKDALEVINNVQFKCYQRILARDTDSLLESKVNGSILAALCVFPGQSWVIAAAAKRGNMERARYLLEDLDKKIKAIKVHGENSEAGLTTAEFKAASNIVNYVNVGPVRSPPLPLISEEKLDEMRRRLKNLGVEVNEEK